MKEIWKNIVGYDTYKISNFGNIKSLGNDKDRKEKFMKVNCMPNLYQSIRLRKNGNTKTFYVHRLVAITFIDNPSNLPLVCHKDNNKQNNNVNNLYWGTYSDNTKQSIAENRFKQVENVVKFNKSMHTCPHCNKIGKSYSMYRWHFNNCKHKKQIVFNFRP